MGRLRGGCDDNFDFTGGGGFLAGFGVSRLLCRCFRFGEGFRFRGGTFLRCWFFGGGFGDRFGRGGELGGCVTGAVLGDEGNGQGAGLVAVGLTVITDGDGSALGGCFCCGRCGATNSADCGCEGEGSDERLAVHFLLLN